MRLRNKACLITGAGSGIGREGALLFAREGAWVACVDLRSDAVEKVAEEIRGGGGTACAIAADVARSAEAERMVRTAERELGGLHVLWNNAGIFPAADNTPEDTPDTLDYAKLARLARWAARVLVHAGEGAEELGWTDLVADPPADARALLRLYGTAGDGTQFPWLLRRALTSDRARVEALVAAWQGGPAPTAADYRFLQLASLRLQAAVWHPTGWWFALW